MAFVLSFRVLPVVLAALSLPWGVSSQAQGLITEPLPAFRHPGAGRVVYFVLTDRFANGTTENDRAGLSGPREVHGFDPTGKGWYHGGDFVGLTQKLDYLAGLGIDTLWITPPFRNQYVQGPSAAYHGYWILDFLRVDPHLGTDAEFRRLVDEAHRRGLRVFLDIVVNHTADVIKYSDQHYTYRPIDQAPFLDASGAPFSPARFAANGVRPPEFPVLRADQTFPSPAFIPSAFAEAKNPAWLNRLEYYHHRGDSTFRGESSLYGDFVGLDDVMTEHPAVLQGFIDIYTYWMREYKIDGYRIDTVKHANPEFWQGFAPAVRAQARALGRPDFFHFGEVAGANSRFLGDYAHETTLDATLDFAFAHAARDFISRGHSPKTFADLWAEDDHHTRPFGNAHLQTTFLGNHDDGRFLSFLQQDNPGASPAELLARTRLGHALLMLSRGQPVLYYGDEQGMRAVGNDMMAREDMFASQTPEFTELGLVGSNRTGRDDKYDPEHPLYRHIAALSSLRRQHPTLSVGNTVARDAGDDDILVFSRFHREVQSEYLIVFNRAAAPQSLRVTTSSKAGSHFAPLAGDVPQALTVAEGGHVETTLPAFGFAVWRNDNLPIRADAPLQGTLRLEAHHGELTFPPTETDAHVFPRRTEIALDLASTEPLGEALFTARRSSRPEQLELLGVDDAPPYRIFWRPNPDWVPGETITFFATFDDRGGRRLDLASPTVSVAPAPTAGGVRGAVTPRLLSFSASSPSAPRTLAAVALGTAPLFYTWYRDDQPLLATEAILLLPEKDASGTYRVVVHNQAGAVLSDPIVIP